MSKEDQLQWEARFGPPAAVAAFAAGLLVLAGQVIIQTLLERRPGLEPLPEFLVSVDQHSSSLIASRVVQALSALCLILVFYYLFRAIRLRNPQMPSWFVYLIFAGPVLYALSQVLGALSQLDVASDFVDGAPIRGEPGDVRADELTSDGQNGFVAGFGLAGTVAVAFLFVMLPLRARRVGLMSPFMGILGVICGVLLVLPLIPGVPVIIQAFWLGAVGLLILGRWPGGRGEAWETGEEVPWPTPAQRRGLAPPPDAAPAPEPDGAEPEPAPKRPSSRKRKRR